MSNFKPTSLPASTEQWIATAPTDVIEAILHPANLELVLQSAFRAAITNGDRPTAELDELHDLQLRVTLSIRTADLRCRDATGTALRTIEQYDLFRVAGSPSRSSIYTAFGSWPYAL